MLNSMLRRFQSNPDLHRQYSEFLQEYEDLGHMVRVKPNLQSTPVYYLPHHAVLRETSLTTKLRVVFNGSAKTTTGVSLNDILHEGPKTQSDIINVISNWRKHKYVYSADITKMFRQVVVHQRDRDLQRILWKGDSEDIIEYQLCTVTYGIRPAPYLAIRTLQQLVTDDGDKFPEAKDIIRENTYVDDVYGGSSTIEQCKRQIEQVNKLCESGGFPLQKWTANHPELLNEIVNTREEKITNHLIDSSEFHRTLGLNWNSEADFFFYLPKIDSNEKTLTKRIILSKVAQLYDPLGWISPFIVQGKLLIQDLWKLNINWDEAVPEIFQTRWNKLHQELNDLIPMRINRHLGISDSTTKFELHGFSDASQIAYGSVLYLRTIDTYGDVRVALISSKSKLAPINLESKELKRKKNIRITIPRLELMAASLLSKHALATAQAMKLNDIKMHLWSDSSISLYWIKSDANRYQQFVKNRIQSIQQTLPQATWHHVPGHQNPADLVSRGVSAKRLVNDSRWLNGPDWLGKPADEWPSTFPELHKTLDLEQKNSFVGNVTVTPSRTWSLLNKFSSLNLLIRVTAWCKRLFLIKVQKLKTSEPKALYQRLVLSPKEIEDSRKFWIRITQAEHFSSEIQQLAKEKQLPNQSKLHRLTPFLDQEGLMRLGGRLRNADLSEAAKHPIIIPRNSTLTQLILHQTHQETLHGQCQLMLSVLRQNYWIVGGRQPVKTFIFKCIRCTRFRGKLACQLMGQLPLRRLTSAKPFAHSGVDYAGPFSILSWRKRGAKTYKGYLVVFVCLTTSAVHLELATDYTTTGFLAAYKRFSSRRGKISTISSDCGTNLVGADNELKRLFSQASKENEVIANVLLRDNTEWKFNPPSSPHFGGKWEAAVKSTKFHIQRVLGDQLLTYEEFSTFLAQIEAILNSRPLTQITEDPTDPEALTPGHFLNAAPLIAVPEPSVFELPVNRLSIYQHIQQMTEKFWRRWSSEYIHQLQEINKWQRREPNLEAGRLVLITDERLPPTKWALGRITEIHLGKDGLSRVATVKTQYSTFTKPIVRLCPLPVEMSPKDELST